MEQYTQKAAQPAKNGVKPVKESQQAQTIELLAQRLAQLQNTVDLQYRQIRRLESAIQVLESYALRR
jgi:uncharacterized coiled-coil protein SlyX